MRSLTFNAPDCRFKTNSWSAIAFSSNNNQLMAAFTAGPIHVSADGGYTWTALVNGPGYPQFAAWSNDGMTLAATSSGQLNVSSDGGLKWQTAILEVDQPYVTHNHFAVAMSADGKTISTAVFEDHIYISTDGGQRWRKSTALGERRWEPDGLAFSADGNTLLTTASGYLAMTTNTGDTWSELKILGQKSWRFAVSADGRTLVAVAGNTTHRSTDGGSTWLKYELVSPRGVNPVYTYFQRLASSADTSRLAAIVLTRTASYQPAKHLYTSSDGGMTWTLRASLSAENEFFIPLNLVAVSADGSRLALPVNRDIIYLSNDGGATWDPPLPSGV